MDLTESQPVLLDFFISNCELTSDGYKVRLIVDGDAIRTLTSWQPYYIYGLKKGPIRFDLNCSVRAVWCFLVYLMIRNVLLMSGKIVIDINP